MFNWVGIPTPLATASRAFIEARSIANFVVTACDIERFAIHNGVGDFEASVFVNFSHGCARNLHLLCALFVSAFLKINQTDHFKLINGQSDAAAELFCFSVKHFVERFGANAAASTRFRYGESNLVFNIRHMSDIE